MAIESFEGTFSEENLKKLFPPDRANQFFEALFGDATEGSFDISLGFGGQSQNQLLFEFRLKERPGKCLACNLTYGLPDVFSRHPVIGVKGLIEEMNQLLNGQAKCVDWKLGRTREITNQLHVVPLFVFLE